MPEKNRILGRATSSPHRARLAADPSLEQRANAAARSMTGGSQTALDRGLGDGALSAAQRTFFEPRFGWSFADIRVHADEGAARFAAQYDAQALTVGRDIYFGAGRHAPETPAGRELMAHELAHVVQQGADPALTGSVQCQKNPPPTPPAATTAQYVHKASGFAIAQYIVNGIDFRLGVLIPDLQTFENQLASIAAEITRANALIGDPAMQVKLCVIAAPTTTRYATYKGAPALSLDTLDANAETARHEMGHAVFAFYRAASADPKNRFKDASMVMADIFARLAATKDVEDEEVRTSGIKERQTHAAGLWIADPPQWSSLASEHPWDDPDEFFASARKAYLTDETALKKAIAKFTKIDKAVAKPAADLLAALKALEKGKAAARPKKVSPDAATELAKLKEPTKIEDSLGTIRKALIWALDPSQMPGAQAPSTPSPAPTPAPTTP